MTDELYSKLVCALTHDLKVCEQCKQCEGKHFAEIRVNLIKEIAKEENKKLPYNDKVEKDLREVR